MRILVLAIALALLSACGSAGKKFDESRVQNIVQGKTTRAEIVEWFGKPFSQTRSTPEQLQGTGIALTYVYTYATAGAFKETKSKALAVTFDARDVVLSHSFNEQ